MEGGGDGGGGAFWDVAGPPTRKHRRYGYVGRTDLRPAVQASHQ